MHHDSYAQEKGLFTFYKQQEKQQEQLKLKFKKKTKKKQKKSKKKIRSEIKSSEKSVFVIAEDNEEEQEGHEPKEAFQQFLKNIKHQHKENKDENCCEKVSINRIKTQPNYSAAIREESSVRTMKKTKIISELSKKYNFLPSKEFKPLSPSPVSPISELINACQQKFYKEPKLTESDPIKNRDYHQKQRSKILSRLRSLEIKNKSNLISSRQSINIRESIIRERCESENKNFFNHIASNMNDQTDDKSAYRLLKDALRLPHIKREVLRTQSMTPNSSQKRLVLAAKNMPYQRKQLRMKHSNERRREFYKLNLMAEYTQSKSFVQGPTINLIDMSKDYKNDESNSQEWQLKRKIIKSRLGLQL